ncbi:ABC transporter substrate-binding protein [Haloplasma contractile]|uniref:Family 1 extracellular solute-binding protein n=1 Tax=Haloplasma contractile SSD-17B TaxID=1033810 RepID=F7PRN3_9MOLU|nr:ABC transporter substrate-binding protein [Haloplasma contractile]ERJ11887.1 family 1 extracellular solute-binding protein [Haloplasma contractile SSD-17B]
MKKILALVVVFAFALTLSACNKDDNKLVIWSFTDELEAQGDIEYWEEMYSEKYDGMEIEYVVVDTADYMTKIKPVLKSGKGAPDVFTGELDMIKNFMEAGYMADLEKMMKDDEDIDFDAVEADFIPYVWQSGQDADGTLRGLSWQSTPGAVFFRADLAELVWPNWDTVTPSDNAPSDVATDADGTYQFIYDFMSYEKFNSKEQLVTTAQEVVDSGQNIKLFPDEQAIRFFAQGENPKSWLKDGSINPERMYDQIEYMEIAKDFYSDDTASAFTINAGEWSPEWFGGISGPVSPVDSDTEYQIMSYTLPTWGLFHVMEPSSMVKDDDGNVTSTYGDWRLASGPNSYYWGGTFLGVYTNSEKKDAAYDFIKSMTLDTDRMLERARENGDVYSRISIMETISSEYSGNPFLGGQNHFDYFLPEAQKIDVSTVTKHDRQLDTLLGTYVEDYRTGEKTLEEALNEFYDEVEATLGEEYVTHDLPTAPRS